MQKKDKKAPEKKEPMEDRKEEKVTVVVPMEQTTPVVPDNFKPSKITRAQVEIIKTQIAKGASDDELKMFLYVCERTGLDPFTRQVHLVPRWDSKLGKEVRTVIVGIDGLRSVAERTNSYAGNDDPKFEGEKEIEYTETTWEGKTKKEQKKKGIFPAQATVTVKKIVQGIVCDFTATAKWEEYYPGDKAGIMWRKMPHNMLGKCAEAKALRKAFPAVMGGLYVAEEMHQAGVGTREASPEQTQAAQFAKAKAGIEKETDEAKLKEYKEKAEKSEKYTDEQKAELVEIINKKLAKEAK